MRHRLTAAALMTGAAFAALVLWPRRSATGMIFDADTGEYVGDVAMEDSPAPSGSEDPSRMEWYSQPTQDVAIVNNPLEAVLYAIRSSEHVYPDDVDGDDCFSIFYGGSRFSDMRDHPVLTGEKRGVPLPPEMCRASGFLSGKCVSTAAGGYQINVPTWREFRQAGAWGPYLTDFSPANQSECARRILVQIGAMTLIEIGDIAGAIRKASSRWASLPGSIAKQGGRTMEFVLARYNEMAVA